jgi:multidrug efflux pump subunit AcrA (membrane-fusion protein)
MSEFQTMPNTNGLDELGSPLGVRGERPHSRDDFPFDDLIEKQPGWLLRSGILLLFGATVFFVAMAAIIHYPDKLPAPFLLTTENPPVELPALATGQIEEFFVKDGEAVVKNQELLYLNNPASLQDVRAFAAMVDKVDIITGTKDYLNIKVPEDWQLGELRQTYTEYVQELKTFQYLLRQAIVFEKIRALEQKAKRQEQLGNNLQKQKKLFEKELSLAEKDYQRNQTLNQQGVTSDLDLEKNEATYLQQQQRLEDMNSNLVRNSVEIAQLQTQMLEMKDERAKAVSEHVIKLKDLSLRFRNEYAAWQQRYLLTAPMDGTVAFTPGLARHQTLKAADAVASILPTDAARERIVARITPPAGGVGKLEVGNRVLLQLDAYPHKEYGHLEARLDAISRLPTPDKDGNLVYEITCGLPDTLTSSIGRPLPFRQKLTGTAQIITKDRSVMHRMLDRVLALR